MLVQSQAEEEEEEETESEEEAETKEEVETKEEAETKRNNEAKSEKSSLRFLHRRVQRYVQSNTRSTSSGFANNAIPGNKRKIAKQSVKPLIFISKSAQNPSLF